MEFKGVFVPIITPFKKNEEIDYKALKDHIKFLIDCGVHGIIPCGSTGEFPLLSLEERKRIISETISTVNGKIPVIVSVSDVRTDNVIELVRYTKDIGADGIMVLPPYYYKLEERELHTFFETISSMADMPVMIYNNPWTAKIDLKPNLLAKLSQEFDIIRYVKESSGDVRRVSEIIELTDGKLKVFCGWDSIALESLLAGAEGWVATSANVIPRATSLLFKLAYEGNIIKAKEIYKEILPLMRIIEDSGKFVQYVKASLNLLGRKVGNPRKPLMPPTKEEVARIQKLLIPIVSKYESYENIIKG